MKKALRITKVTRLLRISEIVTDLRSDKTDEELLAAYDMDWRQLSKVYSKLFFGGYLSEADLIQRREMRRGRDVSHIPLVEISDVAASYQCQICGFTSGHHFSECPECGELNLRRLTKRSLHEQFMRTRANGGA